MINQNIHKLLGALKNVQEHDGYYTALCPQHDDNNNSLSITATDDEKILVKCHTGCDAKQIVYACGCTWTDMFPPKESRKQVNRKIVATYDYHDSDGVLVYQVCRLEEEKNGKVVKTFQQRRPDGKGGWTWKTKGLKKILYRLPELIGAPKTDPVFIVEGEKQVDYLRGLGLIAVCNTGGAGKWMKSYGKLFAERDVVVVPDCDPPNEKTGKIVGAAHAVQVADSCLPHANSVHVVQLPNCQPKWGLDDWLQLGGNTLKDLQELMKDAPQYPEGEIITEIKPEAEEEEMDGEFVREQKMLSEIGIMYAAQGESGGYEVFSSVTKTFTILPATFRYSDLLTACGAPVKYMVQEHSEDSGEHPFREVKNAIALVASQHLPFPEKRGKGVWPVDDSRIAIVTEGELAILNGRRTLQRTSDPLLNDYAYNISRSADPQQWVDLDLLQEDLDQEQTPYLHVLEEVLALVKKWNFRHSSHCQPELLVGLMLASVMQTCWELRPQVFLVGRTYSGKTQLFKQIIERILKSIAERMSGPSAAGVRAVIGGSSIVCLLDELEKSRHRKEIFEMVRAAARGDTIVRSSMRQKVKKFSMRNIFWCAAIESGVIEEADRTRFIAIELDRGDDNKVHIPDGQAVDWGAKLIRIAIHSYKRAKELVELFRDNQYDESAGRLNECYAVPAAAYAAAVGLSDQDAIETYHIMMSVIETDEEVEAEHLMLLHDIFDAEIRDHSTGQFNVVMDMLTSGFDTSTLKANGIGKDMENHYFNRQLLLKNVLDKKKWGEKRLDHILLNIPGAERTRNRLVGAGQNPRSCIAVPNESIHDLLNSQSGDSKTEPPPKPDQPNPFGQI